ncbi:MAG: ankyrin repeat domain-containing protein [Paenibacillaceae bacterium]|nr:ankyrin repeat domain-containing protein [Paenibacillaceae bacterium]
MKSTKSVVSMLQLAVKGGSCRAAGAMLQAGDVTPGERSVALRNAIAGDNAAMVGVLLEGSRECLHRLKLGDRLCQAARLGHLPIVDLLLAAGASPSAVDLRSNCALFGAIQARNEEMVVRLLDAGASVAFANEQGETVARKAAAFDSPPILEAVLRAGAAIDFALTAAVMNNHRANVRLLLLNGADANEANESGITPLIMAMLHGNIRIVELLLRFGANIDQQDMHGDTALIYAARHRRSVVFRYLVGRGASTRLVNHAGENAYDQLVNRS